MIVAKPLRAIAIGRRRETLKDATLKADETRRAADRYAWEVMQNLETQLLRTVATVKKGVEALRTPPAKSGKEVEVISGR